MVKTREKRTIAKKVLLMLCAAVLLITTVLGSSVTDVQAASKAKKAKQAYAKFLKNPTAPDSAADMDWSDDVLTFGLIDTNKDKVLELVIYNESSHETFVYGYCAGKVTLLTKNMGGGCVFHPSRKIIYSLSIPMDGENWESYYKFDGQKAQEIANGGASREGNFGKIYYEKYQIRGKKVSKKKYNVYIDKLRLKKGISSWDMKMHKNTSKNRKKYLG